MESKPDTIKVSALHREEISATHADLFVAVRGSSLVSGDQALKKAKEVNQLVEALTSFGLGAEAIHLQGVHIETSSGMLLKSSSATYRLRIRCEKLDQLADMLDIVGSQKNATLERIQWKYSEDAARQQGLEAALEKAKARAGKVAAALGVKLLGVYDFMENSYDEEMPIPFQPQAAMLKSRAAATADQNLGMDIQHSKTIQVNVDIWYRVSAF
jgi:uncharacterized protein YggE